MVENENCPVCLRHVKSTDITIHHYLPKSKGGTLQDTMRLCKCCHDTLHYLIDIDDVENYQCVNDLFKHEDYREYILFIRDVNHSSMYTVKQIKSKMRLKVA